MKLGDIAQRLQGRLDGDPNVDIVRVAGIEHAQPGDLTFVANTKYVGHLESTRASAVIVGPSVVVPPRTRAIIRCQDPYLAFAQAVSLFAQTVPPAEGVDALACVAPDVTLGDGVSVGPFAAVGPGVVVGARTVIYPSVVIGPGARIGTDCVLHARVSIRERVVLGDRVIVQDGAVVGSDGYGFVTQADKTHLKIPQHGDVYIEDDVEIGANTTIDRPAVGETRVKSGTKIDNLVQIGHGVTIGHRVRFAAQVGIAGSTIVEDDVLLAGQVGVAGHLTIGAGAIASAQTGIPNDVEAGAFVSGYPAIANREWLKSSAVYRRLPALKRRVAELEARLAQLEERLGVRSTAQAPTEEPSAE
ncbi:MAG: UDP-3-O-(3-hydroxymyristoyl)glucosamine N-acyltransferase [Acidimicrobiia bacterium]|nr:UDP-3-O-(3-hydroxymyristoyl)glucosamine N-acyltransferase [Acidimicrobiia bacterium]